MMKYISQSLSLWVCRLCQSILIIPDCVYDMIWISMTDQLQSCLCSNDAMRRNIFLWLRMRASWWLAHQPFQGKVCLKSVSLPSKDQVSQKWDGPFLSIFNFMIHNSTFPPRFTKSSFFLNTLSIFFSPSQKGTRRPDHGFLLLQNLLAGGGESQRQGIWAGGLETKTGNVVLLGGG